MNSEFSRRRVLQGGATLLAAASGGLISRAGEAKPTVTAPPLRPYAVAPNVWFKKGPEMVTCYRAHPTQKYPYLFPLLGPATGLPLTSESGDPWPHHRSIFFGCDVVNGVDFWSAETKPGRIISRGPKVRDPDSDGFLLEDECDWTKTGGEILMRDRRLISIREQPGLVLIDWDIEWTAVVPITIPKNNHSLFAIRAAHFLTPAGGGNLVNADGAGGEKATFGKPSKWCGFHGRARLPGAPVEGLALFDHPENPWGLAPWFTRNYGFASPTPMNFLKAPMRIEEGKSLRLRYRVVAHAGTPAEAGLDALHADWSRG